MVLLIVPPPKQLTGLSRQIHIPSPGWVSSDLSCRLACPPPWTHWQGGHARSRPDMAPLHRDAEGGQRWTDGFARRASPRSPACPASACAHGSAATAFPSPIATDAGPAPLRAGGRPARGRRAPRGRGRRADPAGDRAHALRRGAVASGLAHLRRARRARAGAGRGAVGPRAAARGVRQRRAALPAGRAAARRGADDGAARLLRLALRAGAAAALRHRGRPDRGRASGLGRRLAPGPRARRCSGCPPSPTRARSSRWSASRARASASPARALAELQREVEELRRRDERHTRWLDALALLAEEFRREPGRARSTTGST